MANFSLVHREGGVGNLLLADVAGLLQFLDVIVQVGSCERLSTIRARCALVVMHLYVCLLRLLIASSFSQWPIFSMEMLHVVVLVINLSQHF